MTVTSRVSVPARSKVRVRGKLSLSTSGAASPMSMICNPPGFMAVIASVRHAPSDIDTSLVKQAPATQSAPATTDPLAGAAANAASAPASNDAVPLAN